MNINHGHQHALERHTAKHKPAVDQFIVVAERDDGRRVVFGTYPSEAAATAMAARLRALCGGASVRPASGVADVTPGAELSERA